MGASLCPCVKLGSLASRPPWLWAPRRGCASLHSCRGGGQAAGCEQGMRALRGYCGSEALPHSKTTLAGSAGPLGKGPLSLSRRDTEGRLAPAVPGKRPSRRWVSSPPFLRRRG